MGVLVTNCIIFDIDGTLADCTHRLHLIGETPPKWDEFFAGCADDQPITHMLFVADTLAASTNIIFVTGRPERSREATLAWLKQHLPGGEGWAWSEDSRRDLYMRADGDHRPDTIVKSELLDQVHADGHLPLLVFEDRAKVVKMWRERGVPCAQVAEGDY